MRSLPLQFCVGQPFPCRHYIKSRNDAQVVAEEIVTSYGRNVSLHTMNWTNTPYNPFVNWDNQIHMLFSDNRITILYGEKNSDIVMDLRIHLDGRY